MPSLQLLISVKTKVLKGLIFTKNRNDQIRNISMAVVMVILLYASYLFFHDLIFKYIFNLEDIGFLLIDRLVSLGFLAFFFMLIISSFVVSLAALFRSAETEYLFSTPVTTLELFTIKYIDIVVYSSWAILIMALPILYSYAKVREFGALKIAMTGIIVLVPFIIFATAAGTLLALLAAYISKRIPVKKIVLYGVLVFSALIYGVIHFSQPTQLIIPFTEDFRALNIFINNFELNAHPLTPNFWLIQCLRALVINDYRTFLLYGAALISSALFVFTLLYSVAERLFFPTWLASIEQSLTKRCVRANQFNIFTALFSKPSKSQFRTLLIKDILIFVREPSQWSQLFLLLALTAIYFINLNFIPKEIEIEQWRTIISIMNFGFCGFVLATLAVRFVFPSISMEGDSFWVLGSAPLSVKDLFREKFWSSFVVFFIITEFLAVISGQILNLESLYQLLTFSGIGLMSIALASLSIGFGAAYPDFAERNPSRIASSPGGILTVVISLLYIAIMMTFLAIPSYRYTDYLVKGGDFPMGTIVMAAAGAVFINVLTITVPLYIGAKSLSQREF